MISIPDISLPTDDTRAIELDGSLTAPVDAQLIARADAQLTALAEAQLSAEVDAVVSRAGRAQALFENWSEDQVEALLRDLAEALEGAAEDLAIATVAETGMGNVPDKTLKNRFASRGVYASLAGKVGHGALSVDTNRQVTEIASPVGVVFAVVPITNPAATAMFKTLIALKGRNALIMSFHRGAQGVAERVGHIVRRVLEAHRAPLDLVQWVHHRSSRAKTRTFMSHPQVSLILATGGSGLVKAAYSSGTPAIGVGPGNAPAWICADAGIDEAARAVVMSKTFDNGLICGAEHNLVVDDRVAEPFVEALTRHGAVVLTVDELRAFARRAIDPASGRLRHDLIGQSGAMLAREAGIERSYPIRLLIARTVLSKLDGFYGGEKLAPFLSLFTVSGEDEGLTLCRTLLRRAGAGHTAVIHTANAARVDRFARAMPASRILVNSPAAQGCCGMTTGLECSLTLGCGTFGGNSTTDNVTYRHLLNIKRVAYGRESNR